MKILLTIGYIVLLFLAEPAAGVPAGGNPAGCLLLGGEIPVRMIGKA